MSDAAPTNATTDPVGTAPGRPHPIRTRDPAGRVGRMLCPVMRDSTIPRDSRNCTASPTSRSGSTKAAAEGPGRGWYVTADPPIACGRGDPRS